MSKLSRLWRVLYPELVKRNIVDYIEGDVYKILKEKDFDLFGQRTISFYHDDQKYIVDVAIIVDLVGVFHLDMDQWMDYYKQYIMRVR